MRNNKIGWFKTSRKKETFKEKCDRIDYALAAQGKPIYGNY